ncbi:MAG: hypothetical protein HQL99_15615 [Magnetococcales bacterium]|nr:hypothetical protein [Magnetococcales bacterium]
MTTIEIHDTKKGAFVNGLIAKGFVREAVRHANMPESAIRGWSFGLGRGLSGVSRQTGWTRLDMTMSGGEP